MKLNLSLQIRITDGNSGEQEVYDIDVTRGIHCHPIYTGSTELNVMEFFKEDGNPCCIILDGNSVDVDFYQQESHKAENI